MGVENLSRTLELVSNDEDVMMKERKSRGYWTWNPTETFMIEADVREWKLGIALSRYGFDIQVGPVSFGWSR